MTKDKHQIHNDPYVVVDKFNDKLVKFDMHTLTMMFVEYSNDDGETWSAPFLIGGYYVPQDPLSIASMPHSNAIVGDVVYVYCINTGSPPLGLSALGQSMERHTWDAQRIGYPTESFGNQCSGLHGHVAGGSDGSSTEVTPLVKVQQYTPLTMEDIRSEHRITADVPMQQGWHSHEVAVAVDEAEMSITTCGFQLTRCHGMHIRVIKWPTWSEPMMVAAPTVTKLVFQQFSPAMKAGLSSDIGGK